MIRSLQWSAVVFLLTCVVFERCQAVRAEQTQPPSRHQVRWSLAESTKAPQSSAPGHGLRLQESDQESTPLVPVRPRDVPTEKRLDSLSWFMTGRVLEIRNEKTKALDAYRRAIEFDPQAAEVYRSMVPLAFEMNQTEEAIQLAIKAVELLPEDHELLHQLGIRLASQQKIPEAIRYLKQAADSPAIPKNAATYILLMRELGILYSVTGQAKPAGDAYAIVFDALQHPEKYSLDLRTKRRLMADPQTSYERIGQVLLDGERLELASQAFELAAKSGRSGTGNLSFYQSKVLLLSNKPDEALAELQKYFDGQRQSKGREAYALLGEILHKMNRGDELIGRLEILAEKDPNNHILQYFLAERLVATGNLEKARGIYETVLERGGDTAGYLGLAAVLRKLDRPSELLDAMGRALTKVRPESLESVEAELKIISSDDKLVRDLLAAGRTQQQAQPTQLTFEESYLLAKLAAGNELLDEAAEFFRHALSLDKSRKPVIYREFGILMMKHQRYAEAAQVYADAANERSLADEKPDFLYRLSQAREFHGDTDGAITAVREAQQLRPDIPELQLQEGWIYTHAKKYEEAITVFEKALSSFPEQKDIVRRCQFSLSNIHVQKGEVRKGEEILEKVLADDPEDPAVNNDLGYLYADQGKNLEQAEKMIRKAVASDPENSAYQDSLGWVLFKLGRFEEARAPLEKAVANSQGTGDATLLDHLGDLYLRLDLIDLAIETWDKALKHAEKEGESEANLKERLHDKLKQHRK